MVKKKAATGKSPSTPLIPKISMGGKDVIGQKPLLKGVNNNYVYGLGALLVVGIGAVAMNPALLRQLTGQRAPPGATVTAPPTVQPGSAVTINGSFNPPVAQGYYTVTNQQGQPVASGSLGSNVSTFSTQIPATNLADGTYTVTVSDSATSGAPGPTGTSGPQGPGQVYPTAATMNNNMAQGPGQSGPESIALS